MPSVPFSSKPSAGFGIVALNPGRAISKFISYANRVIEPALFVGLKKSLLVIERESIRLINSGYYQPAVDSGHMKQSVNSRVLDKTHKEITGAVGVVDTFYAIYVHEGTKKMEKRQFLTDAVENKKEEIIDLFRGIIKTHVKVKK